MNSRNFLRIYCGVGGDKAIAKNQTYFSEQSAEKWVIQLSVVYWTSDVTSEFFHSSKDVPRRTWCPPSPYRFTARQVTKLVMSTFRTFSLPDVHALCKKFILFYCRSCFQSCWVLRQPPKNHFQATSVWMEEAVIWEQTACLVWAAALQNFLLNGKLIYFWSLYFLCKYIQVSSY